MTPKELKEAIFVLYEVIDVLAGVFGYGQLEEQLSEELYEKFHKYYFILQENIELYTQPTKETI